MAARCNAIMVVDDHDETRSALEELLAGAGYRTVGCSNAVDALSVLHSGEPVGLILLDLMMPGINGLRFRNEQRATDGLRDIPVVVITGVAEPHAYDANLRAVAYLKKPLEVDKLLALVKAHCGEPTSA